MWMLPVSILRSGQGIQKLENTAIDAPSLDPSQIGPRDTSTRLTVQYLVGTTHFDISKKTLGSSGPTSSFWDVIVVHICCHMCLPGGYWALSIDDWLLIVLSRRILKNSLVQTSNCLQLDFLSFRFSFLKPFHRYTLGCNVHLTDHGVMGTA